MSEYVRRDPGSPTADFPLEFQLRPNVRPCLGDVEILDSVTGRMAYTPLPFSTAPPLLNEFGISVRYCRECGGDAITPLVAID
eukprot:CAMPEP_0182896586 /NCGR_PEP_ID=MMETSP0034_2-20130328/26365_1 /TAXON_ID=156128 /ORGANISM="Nephroselmis pyriformis, Strain CCMP717" /LENGTH=82 /DNA_ID=CAMNT_0025030457 /DNA_START=26 /DNA_END=271 /DNA_ORIENTATION=-